MNTVEEVKAILAELEEKEGKEAAHAWVTAHAGELPEDVRGEIVFAYSIDAFLEDAEDQEEVAEAMEAGLGVIEELETEAAAIEEALKIVDVKDRLNDSEAA